MMKSENMPVACQNPVETFKFKTEDGEETLLFRINAWESNHSYHIKIVPVLDSIKALAVNTQLVSKKRSKTKID